MSFVDSNNLKAPGLSNIDFFYFSGTGNTLLIVKRMRDTFVENGTIVNINKMESSSPADINPDHIIGLAFPVALQGTNPIVWDFVRSLPETNGTKIFMVDTLGMYSGGIVGPMKKILSRKGYNTIGAKEIVMPNNLFPKKIDLKKNNRKVQKGLRKAERYANDILNGTSRWSRVPLFSELIARISQSERIWKSYSNRYQFHIDASKCKRCGLCKKLCPVDNIAINSAPDIGSDCVLCMRCISFCPMKAIYTTKKKTQQYRAVKAKEMLGNANIK